MQRQDILSQKSKASPRQGLRDSSMHRSDTVFSVRQIDIRTPIAKIH